MREREVARFERAGDVRVMSLGEEEGRIVVREDLAGPSVLVAYGDEWRSLRVSFGPASVSGLLRAIGSSGEGESLWAYLADESHDIVDLMDLCDAAAVPYSFTSLGSGGEVAYRPA